jgi:signal transduction histidine kinase
MAQILDEVHELLREQAREKKQTLAVDILDHPTITANREHLKQIWMNLMSNAIKYTPEGGHIEVRLQADQDSLLGAVKDSGIGISEDDMQHLFQEFFRTDEAKASGAMGTGLGLSIVKQIIDAYGGEIKATSKLGQGTRFTFVLPLEPDIAPAGSAESAQGGARPGPAPKPAGSERRPAYPMTHTRAFTLADDPGDSPDDR